MTSKGCQTKLAAEYQYTSKCRHHIIPCPLPSQSTEVCTNADFIFKRSNELLEKTRDLDHFLIRSDPQMLRLCGQIRTASRSYHKGRNIITVISKPKMIQQPFKSQPQNLKTGERREWSRMQTSLKIARHQKGQCLNNYIYIENVFCYLYTKGNVAQNKCDQLQQLYYRHCLLSTIFPHTIFNGILPSGCSVPIKSQYGWNG